MKKLLPVILFLFLPGKILFSQTLFDDSRLGSIYITIPPDSLSILYDSVLSDHYYRARFVFDDNTRRDTLENVGFRLRGNTSRYSKKKSFKISFSEYVPGRFYQGVKKINLNGEHNDPTMIREKLFYEIWKKAGMPERRTSFVRVYINGTYYGLYTNLEEMEKDWLTRNYQDPEGNLFKCTYPADLVYHGSQQQTYRELENTTATGGQVYELQTNKSQDDYAGLVDLVTVLDREPTGNFPAQISLVMNVPHFLKALALDVATGNWDDYSYNKNNYYLYERPADSKFDFITYDPDNTFGVDWFHIDWSTRDCRNWINRSTALPLAQKLLAVPGFFDQYKCYLDTITSTITHPDSLFPRIDQIKQLIQTAAEEDLYRTLDYEYSVADFNNSFNSAIDEHTPIGLKPFLEIRRQKTLSQLHPAGVAEGRDQMRLRIFPDPAVNRITVEFTGIGPANGVATVSDLSGRRVLQSGFGPGALSLDVGSLIPGIYFLEVNAGGDPVKTRFIKE